MTKRGGAPVRNTDSTCADNRRMCLRDSCPHGIRRSVIARTPCSETRPSCDAGRVGKFGLREFNANTVRTLPTGRTRSQELARRMQLMPQPGCCRPASDAPRCDLPDSRCADGRRRTPDRKPDVRKNRKMTPACRWNREEMSDVKMSSQQTDSWRKVLHNHAVLKQQTAQKSRRFATIDGDIKFICHLPSTCVNCEAP
jgi:hypothetical protein